MLIPVIYADGRHDLVKEYILDTLIQDKSIQQFKRSEGWVDINTDRLRRKRPEYAYQ